MKLNRADVIAFAAGLTSMLQVRVIGHLSLVEVAFAVLAPVYLLTRYRALPSRLLRPFLLLSAAWLGSALATDLYRQNTVENTLKGAFTLVLWIACLVCTYVMFSGRPAAAKWYALGLAFSTVLSIYVLQPGYLQGRAASFRTTYAGALSAALMAFVVFAYRRHPRLVMLTMLLCAFVCLGLGSRALGGAYLVVSLMTYYFYRRSRRVPENRPTVGLTRRQRLGLIVGFVAVSAATMVGYQAAGSKGWLGQIALKRSMENAEAKIGILAGRSQFIGGVLAIIDSPVLGYGSWARDTGGYYLRCLALAGRQRSAARLLAMNSENVMPGHSHVVGSWVFHGLMGGVFWIFVIVFVVRHILRGFPGDRQYLAYQAAIAVNTLWAVFFAPFGQRPSAAAGLVFLIVCAEAGGRRRHDRAAPALAPPCDPAPEAVDKHRDE